MTSEDRRDRLPKKLKDKRNNDENPKGKQPTKNQVQEKQKETIPVNKASSGLSGQIAPKTVAEPSPFTVKLQNAYRSLQKNPDGLHAVIEKLQQDASLPEERSLVYLFHDKILIETNDKSECMMDVLAKASIASYPPTAEQPYSMGRIKLFANACMKHKLDLAVEVTLRHWLLEGPMQVGK